MLKLLFSLFKLLLRSSVSPIKLLARDLVVILLLAADSAVCCCCLLASLSLLRPKKCSAMVRFLVGLLLLLLDCCCWVVFELLVTTAPGLLAPVESVLDIAAAAVVPSRGDCSDLRPYVLLSGSIYNSPYIQTKALLRQYID